MYETGKLEQVTAEMRQYNLHILGISKSKWTTQESRCYTVLETTTNSTREEVPD